MQDAKVLSACIASREAYDAVAHHVDEREFSPLAAQWWTFVQEWYERDKAASRVDEELLRARASRVIDEKHRETHIAYFDSLPEPVSPENVVQEMLEIKRHAAGMELCAEITGKADAKRIERLLSNYSELLVATKLDRSDVIYAGDMDDVEEVLGVGNKIPLFPKALDERVEGGLYPGDFLLLFAYPEMGKTLFCVNLVANWLRIGKKILYIGNEDGINKIKRRVCLNLANMTNEQSRKFPDEFKKRGRERGIDDRLVAVHLHPGSIPEIEELVKEHSPDILVVDQIRNVGAQAENNTTRLNRVAVDFRQLLSKYQILGVGVGQANPGEHGKKKIWLEYDDVEGSRTGLPSQSDLQIGISGDNQMQLHNTRAVSICRNKESGNHEGLTLSIDPQRNKVL